MIGVEKLLPVVAERRKSVGHKFRDLPPKKGHRFLSLRLSQHAVLAEVIVFNIRALDSERRLVLFVVDCVGKLFHTVNDAVTHPFPHLRERAQPRIRV